MKDIKKHESRNEFVICGTLNTIKITEGTSNKKNDDFVAADIEIRVDQNVNGTMEESIVPIKLFSMRHKTDKSLNANYDRIKSYGDRLIPLTICDPGEEDKASQVRIEAAISENSFKTRDDRIVNAWQLTTNFVNDKKRNDKEEASFIVTGVVVNDLGSAREMDSDGNETGRLIVKLCLVGWGGRANVVEFVAEGSAAEHIERNWAQGDTVTAAGFVVISQKTVSSTEDFGFGDMKHDHTVSKRELLITAGSGAGLSEDESYDASDIKVALDERLAYLNSLTVKAKEEKPSPKKDNGFGF